MEQSNREITLAVMIEDLPAVEEIDTIAAIEGIDIVAVGRSEERRVGKECRSRWSPYH